MSRGDARVLVPVAPRLDDDAYVVFGRRDGIPDTPLLSLTPTTGGRLLLGTADIKRGADLNVR